jgi:hypothetical protein
MALRQYGDRAEPMGVPVPPSLLGVRHPVFGANPVPGSRNAVGQLGNKAVGQ